MANKYVDTILNDDGQGVDNVSVSMKLAKNDTTILSMTTGASGEVVWSESEVGYPGPIYVQAIGNGVTRIQPGTNIGQIGPIWFSDLVRAFRMMRDGVVPDVDGELEVTAAGDDMDVDVASGMAFNFGLPFYRATAKAITIAGNSSGDPRIDLIVLRTYPPGTEDEGAQELVAIQGTPASSPSAPTATHDDEDVWELALAEVLVENGASTITPDKVTDLRTFTAGPLVNGSIETAALADSAVTEAKIDDGAVTSSKLAPGIDAAMIADGSVSNTEFQRLDGVTSSIQSQIDGKLSLTGGTMTGDITLSGGADITGGSGSNITTPGQVSGGTVASTGAGVVIGGTGALITSSPSASLSQTELSYLDGVTSGIQAQLNGKAATSHTHAGDDIVSGTVPFAQLPTGTTGSTVAIGDHTHTADSILPSQSGQSGKVLKTNGSTASWQNEASGAAWGGITGTLSNQTDLQNALDAKASSSHTHTARQHFGVRAQRNAVASGGFTVTNSTQEDITGLSDTQALSSGVTYDLFVTGHAQLSAGVGGSVEVAIEVLDGSGNPIWNKSSWWIGTPTEGGERSVGPVAEVNGIAGGQTITVKMVARRTTANGTVGSASFIGQLIARGVGGVT